MIDIPLIHLVMLYLVAVVLLVGISWGAGWWRRKREWREEARCRVVCRACGHVHSDHSRAAIVHCPHCGSPNERAV